MLLTQIQNNLLLVNDLDVNFLYGKIGSLYAKNVDYCDLYLQSTQNESFTLDENIIKTANFSLSQGIGIRAICGEKTFLSHSSSLNKNTIDALVDNIFIEQGGNKNSDGGYRSYQDEAKMRLENSIYTFVNPITSFDSAYKIDILNKINQQARAKDHVINVIASLSLEYDEICIANGNIASDIRPLIHLSISVIVKNNNATEKGHSGCGGRYLLSELTDDVISQRVNEAHVTAMLKLESTSAPSGQMQVVLGNAWAGVILHEAVGHGLEGDFNRKGSSAFSGKIGTMVASPSVTVIDDGSILSRRGSLNVDDEGTPTQKNVLIENGVLRGYMFDKLNANLMGCESTGNARRESYCHMPLPRMTNTYMDNGKYNPNEIIESVEHGIYADNFEGGQVDITSGQFVFNASVAWVIKNGKLAYPVKGCALVGNGPECLKYVSMVGNDSRLDYGIGMCGKDGQSVPVGVGQPTIRIDSGLVVGGTNQ